MERDAPNSKIWNVAMERKNEGSARFTAARSGDLQSQLVIFWGRMKHWEMPAGLKIVKLGKK